MDIKKIIEKNIKNTLKLINIKKKYNYKIYNNKKFGDYQINGIINIAKKEKINIKYLTELINKKIKLNKIIKKTEIIKIGFINIYIKKKIFINIINKQSYKKNFGIKKNKKEKIIIDYSSPNIAKSMHIGHLRSTIIGDSIANIFSFLGYKVIRINHIGDWGTQFGIITTWIKINKLEKKIKKISFLEKIYKKAQIEFNKKKKFYKKCKYNVVQLQNNNPKIIKIWKKITNITILENQKIYKYLKINLHKKNIFGESFYKKMIPNIIKDLRKKKIAEKNNNAIIININKNKNTYPLIIKKKDGAYLYATTDITCIKYRYETYKPKKIIYVIDSRQKEYMKKIFFVAKKSKYVSKKTKLIHCDFGTILNKSGKPFKTRNGKNIKIKKIIRKIFKEAKKKINKKYKKIYSKSQINNISKKITISAIKYMDLSRNRIKNYIFNIKQILSFNNNTGPYIQYAYTRIVSLLKKNNKTISYCNKKLKIKKINNLELNIIKKIYNLKQIINESSNNNSPHIICNFLYKITKYFSKFYEKEKIKSIKNKEIKNSKLKIISIIGKTIKICLSLLGIPVLKKM